jgi:hypothetical protein
MACKRLAPGVIRRPLRFLVAVCRLVLAGSVGCRWSRPLEPTGPVAVPPDSSVDGT